MIISAYNDDRYNHASLEVVFDENCFPTKYKVDVRYGSGEVIHRKFPGTKKGAKEASREYESYTTIFKYQSVESAV